jgi:hypothetical protein
MKRRDVAIALALALCVVGLVACGGGGSSAGGGSAGGASGSAGGGESAAGEEARLEFAECMRGHGVEVEDPKPGHGIAIDGKDPKTKEALAACNGKLDGAGQELSGDEDEKFKEGALAFARCMRDEGIEMGDPSFPGPGKFLLDIKGLDTESPAFVAAQESCGEKLPQLKGIGIGG